MHERSPAETKKIVCRSLTEIVKASPLKESIDPRSLFVMLSGNYSMLAVGSKFQLAPIWDALSATHGPDALAGLFLKFGEALSGHGFEVVFPAHVESMSASQRAAALRLFIETEDREFTPLPEAFIQDVIFGEAETSSPDDDAVRIGTGDLAPVIDEDFKRRVVQAASAGVRAASVGAKLDSTQLAFMLDQNFGEICDGKSFNFGPIVGAMREVAGVTDREIYEAILRVERGLSEIGVRVVEPALALDEATRARVRDDAASDTLRGRAPSNWSEEAIAREPAHPRETPTTKKDQLEKYGFTAQPTIGRRSRVRAIALVAIFVGIAGVAFLNRPNRSIDIGPYDAIFPLASAAFRDGAFTAVMDEVRWYALSVEERTKRLDAFEAMLKNEGRIPNAQIRDAKGRLLLTASAPGKLARAKALLADPSAQPKRAAVEPSAPATAKVDETTPTAEAASEKKDAEAK